MTASRNKQIALRNLHIAIFLFGLTAILGDLIQLSALMIVWWRVLITTISLLFFVKPIQLFKTLPLKKILYFATVGIIVGLHWLTFYGAIKLANASIALVCFATTSFFTAILEPLIIKRKFRVFELLLGLIIIPAMWMIVNSSKIDIGYGLLVGLSSAFLAALFSTLNKKAIHEINPMEITFIELGSAWIFLSLLLPFVKLFGGDLGVFWPSAGDFGYLLILALLCTTFAHVLSLRALKHISAFLFNLSINLEPVYGIVLAWIILDEGQDFNTNFIYGSLIILLSIGIYPLLSKKIEPTLKRM